MGSGDASQPESRQRNLQYRGDHRSKSKDVPAVAKAKDARDAGREGHAYGASVSCKWAD